MKVLSGISVLALLIAGAATPSFGTSLPPGSVVTPGTVTSSSFNLLANTGVTAFSFGGDTGSVQEEVGNWGNNPFGSNDVSFVYQIQVTGGHINNLTTGVFNIPGISIDVQQFNGFIDAPFGPTGPWTPAVNASLTTDGTTLGFGFASP